MCEYQRVGYVQYDHDYDSSNTSIPTQSQDFTYVTDQYNFTGHTLCRCDKRTRHRLFFLNDVQLL